MPNRNEASSLVALRELRDMERRRRDEAAVARARVERERRAQEEARKRADEERRAREAEHRVSQGRLAADVARLHSELDLAHAQVAQLRGELERSCLAELESSTLPGRASPHVRWFGWLGLSAGASMLVGAFALSAAMRPRELPQSSREPSRAACPESRPAREPEPPSIMPPAPPPTVSRKPPARPRPPTVRPRDNQPPTVTCDGRDPLCGLDLGAIDDVGKQRGKAGRSPR